MKTDQQIQADVMGELKWIPELHSTEIGVAVKDGIVTLSGTVDSYTKKRAAEIAASKVSGVKAVAEDIEVKLFSLFKRNDTEIATRVVETLKSQSSVNPDKIIVKVEDGWVTLQGQVEWEFQRVSARNTVSNLMGVRGITNLIEIAPKVKMTEVKDKIASAFVRNATIDSSRIKVETIGDKVILKGTVRSLTEKHDAANAAWSAPGVSQVENKLEVDYVGELVDF